MTGNKNDVADARALNGYATTEGQNRPSPGSPIRTIQIPNVRGGSSDQSARTAHLVIPAKDSVAAFPRPHPSAARPQF